jgi:hypothetical protein
VYRLNTAAAAAQQQECGCDRDGDHMHDCGKCLRCLGADSGTVQPGTDDFKGDGIATPSRFISMTLRLANPPPLSMIEKRFSTNLTFPRHDLLQTSSVSRAGKIAVPVAGSAELSEM